MNEAQARRWERTRKWGFGVFCIPRIAGIFLLLGIVDYFLVDRDLVRLAAELRSNLLVSAVVGIVFGILDWRSNENKYRQYKSEN